MIKKSFFNSTIRRAFTKGHTRPPHPQLSKCVICEASNDNSPKWVSWMGWQNLAEHYEEHFRVQFMKRQSLHSGMSEIALSRYLPWDQNYRGRNDEYDKAIRKAIRESWQHPKFKQIKKVYDAKMEQLKNQKRRMANGRGPDSSTSNTEDSSTDSSSLEEPVAKYKSQVKDYVSMINQEYKPMPREEPRRRDSSPDSSTSSPEWSSGSEESPSQQEPMEVDEPDDEFTSFRDNLKTQDELYKEYLLKAPLTCEEGGPYCTTFASKEKAQMHRKLYHSKYRSEECEKCWKHFETRDQRKRHKEFCKGKPPKGNFKKSASPRKSNSPKLGAKKIAKRISRKPSGDSSDDSESHRENILTDSDDDELVSTLKQSNAYSQMEQNNRLESTRPNDMGPSTSKTKKDHHEIAREKHKESKKKKKEKRSKGKPTVTDPVLGKHSKTKELDGITHPVEAIIIPSSPENCARPDSPVYSDDDVALDEHPNIRVEFNRKAMKELGTQFDSGCFVASGFPKEKAGPHLKMCIFCGTDFQSKYNPSSDKYNRKFENHMSKCLQQIPFKI